MSADVVFAAAALSALPPAAFVLATRRPDTFALPTSLVNALGGQRTSSPWTIAVGALVAVPVFLLLLASGSAAAYVWGYVLSSLAALYGAQRLGGVPGLVGATAGLAVASVTGWGPLASALALLAGWGGGSLLAGTLRPHVRIAFLFLFAALDMCIVWGGLVGDALAQLPLAGSLSPSLAAFVPDMHWQSWPIYNRIEIGGVLLGAGDIAYAVIVAAAAMPKPARFGRVLCVFVVAQGTLAAIALLAEVAMPATLPGLLALLVAIWPRRDVATDGPDLLVADVADDPSEARASRTVGPL